MPDWVINVLRDYVLSKPTFGILLIILIVFHYVDKIRTIQKFSVGACRGRTAYCRYDTFAAYINVINTRFISMIQGTYLQWREDFDNYVQQNNIHLSIKEKTDLFGLMQGVFYLSFFRGYINTLQSAFENHLPETGTAEFDRYVKEKFIFVWNSFWEKYEEVYREDIFYIPLTERKKVLETRKEKFYGLMYEMYQVMNDKKRFLIESNLNAQKNGVFYEGKR